MNTPPQGRSDHDHVAGTARSCFLAFTSRDIRSPIG